MRQKCCALLLKWTELSYNIRAREDPLLFINLRLRPLHRPTSYSSLRSLSPTPFELLL
jgi:hypothetical protein